MTLGSPRPREAELSDALNNDARIACIVLFGRFRNPCATSERAAAGLTDHLLGGPRVPITVI